MFSELKETSNTLIAEALLVEVDEESAELISHTLAKRGLTARAKLNGQVALSVLGVNQYDMIVLCWLMPGLSGIVASAPSASKTGSASRPSEPAAQEKHTWAQV